MVISLRNRYVFLTSIALSFVFVTVYLWRSDHAKTVEPVQPLIPTPPADAIYQPKYKNTSTLKSLPIVDNFPLAAWAHSTSDLPPVPSWNQPPSPHVSEVTPLFIGFTRNWRILQQVVVSYITAGWPASDIYVVENTGVMNSNKKGQLSLQNPFFLNHTRLHLLGVNVLVTPTLLTFAQLQNFYLHTSIQNDWGHYFWSHMDVVALSFEDQYFASHKDTILPPSDPKHDYSDFPSIYKLSLSSLRNATALSANPKWAMRFFSYDRLALVNVQAFIDIGGWDTLIPFYMTDCDMHARLEMEGYDIREEPSGMVFDVAGTLDDLEVLYRKKGGPEASWQDPFVLMEDAEAAEKAHDDMAGKSKDATLEERDDDDGEWEEFTATGGNVRADRNLKLSAKALWEEDTIFSPTFQQLIRVLDNIQGSKHSNARGRNTWQARQTGGQGEPFYRDSEGFEIGIQMTIEHGRAVFSEKWGHRGCDIAPIGLKAGDAWRVHHDWD